MQLPYTFLDKAVLDRVDFVLVLVVYLFLVASSAQAQALSEAEERLVLEQGRLYTEQFYSNDIDALVPQFSEPMLKAVGGQEGLQAFREQVGQQLGEEIELGEETTSTLQGLQVYRRVAQFEKARVVIEWALDKQNKVQGFTIRLDTTSEAPSPYLEYQTKTNLRLPFDGEVYVFWGGRTVAENYHAAYLDQRFAYDFVVMKEGMTHTADGKANENYYCFGLDILAPGAGVVRAAVDDLPDQTPGVMDAENPFGNHVILDHQNGEVSFLAHFQEGSLAVKTGDKVEAGDVLGRCGNSGNSSEPHLHYHLQTTDVPFGGDGLPAQFQNYLADGQTLTRGEPVQGQTIVQP
jgi:Peptidase family M23